MDTNYFYSMHVLDLVLLLSIADNSTRISGWVHLGQGDRKPYCSTSSWHSYSRVRVFFIMHNKY